MLILPKTIMPLVLPFRPIFNKSTWLKAQVVMVGAILSPGKRTVTAALRVMGLSQEGQFAKYHHVLNRAAWSPLKAAQILLGLLLKYFDQGDGPLVFGFDETIERRWGPQIRARGIYRDAVRSSKEHFVKASGLRWISLMWLTAIPWAQRVWALPILTALAPSERFYETSVRSHKKLTDWARQLIYQVRRWLPTRTLVVVADSSYAVLELLHAVQSLANPVAMITRLRLDAALYEPAPPYAGVGRPRKKGQRLPTLQAVLEAHDTCWSEITLAWYDGQVRTLEITSAAAVWYHGGLPPVPIRWVLVRDPSEDYDPLALLCTDQDYDAAQIVNWFVLRWQIEVTFEEVRAHLGVETQRQWSDLAIARTTPSLLGLFSWITVAAHVLRQEHPLPIRQAAWYVKDRPTFSDAIAWVRLSLWNSVMTFCMSPLRPNVAKIPAAWANHLIETLCYAA
jgi:hypothetical protein